MSYSVFFFYFREFRNKLFNMFYVEILPEILIAKTALSPVTPSARLDGHNNIGAEIFAQIITVQRYVAHIIKLHGNIFFRNNRSAISVKNKIWNSIKRNFSCDSFCKFNNRSFALFYQN